MSQHEGVFMVTLEMTRQNCLSTRNPSPCQGHGRMIHNANTDELITHNSKNMSTSSIVYNTSSRHTSDNRHTKCTSSRLIGKYATRNGRYSTEMLHKHLSAMMFFLWIICSLGIVQAAPNSTSTSITTSAATPAVCTTQMCSFVSHLCLLPLITFEIYIPGYVHVYKYICSFFVTNCVYIYIYITNMHMFTSLACLAVSFQYRYICMLYKEFERDS